MALCSPSLAALSTANDSWDGVSSLSRLSPSRCHYPSPLIRPASGVWTWLPDKSHRLESAAAFPIREGCAPRYPTQRNARSPTHADHDNASGHCRPATHQSPIPHPDDVGGLGETPQLLPRVAPGHDTRLFGVCTDEVRSEPISPGCPAYERRDQTRHAQSCPPSAFAAGSS